ncbi:MAG: DNA alkylation repair protein [Campylobacteraceae bacterium]|nr:DNA alkylation repair protein [Campylobacteraceae bacterium]
MEAFKNIFSFDFVEELASLILIYDKSFKKEAYVKEVNLNLESLELKDRMRLISSCINLYTSLEYKEIIEVLIKVKSHFKDRKNIGLVTMVFPDFVEVFGLNEVKVSLYALEEFTKESSSEFAIRTFIIKYEKESMLKMLKFSKSSNEDLRRLSSEGSRPRLPWAIALPSFKINPTLVFEILENLKNDESAYVRKSVANNLNDISKDNEALVISFLKENINKNKNLDSLLKHGCRTLLKKGHQEVLGIFGFKKIDKLKVIDFVLDKEVKLGNELNFSFELSSSEILGNLRLEFEIEFVRLNNKIGKKVFMLSSCFCKEKKKSFIKKYSFKQISTRKYYEGVHSLSIIVNGVKVNKETFYLKSRI